MSSEISIKVENLSKCYQIYDQPRDRLKQFIVPRLQRAIGQPSRQYFREFWALKEVSFEVKRGETVGIIGRNGSGKSTLLQMICGTLNPTGGSIQTHGRIAALLELGSGFNPEFSGRENVYMNGAVLGLSREEIDQRFDAIAAFADIGEFIEQPVKTYSSGMLARLAFSVAIHVDPEILIADEILAVGDSAFQRRCLSKFYEIRDRGCTILFVSHDQYQVKSVCQRALYLKAGRQIMFGQAGRVIDQYMIEMEAQFASVSTEASASSIDSPTVDQDVPELSKIACDETNYGVEVAAQKIDASNIHEPDHIFQIRQVSLTDCDGNMLDVVATGQSVRLSFDFIALVDTLPAEISFVFNLYRHDQIYLCGTTTLMDQIPAYRSSKSGRVSIDFPGFPLLSGQYIWRVAINDNVGLITYAEAKNICAFRVEDNFNAVGMFNLARRWVFRPGDLNNF